MCVHEPGIVFGLAMHPEGFDVQYVCIEWFGVSGGISQIPSMCELSCPALREATKPHDPDTL